MWQYLQTGRSHKRKRKSKINAGLCTELERMRYMKCKIIPVVTGAIGTATKGLKKNWKSYKEYIQWIHCKIELYWNMTHNTESTAE